MDFRLVQLEYSTANISEKRNIHFLDWGNPDNRNVLVCVHGLTRNAMDFNFLAREVQDQYRVICLDMIGRGRSDQLADDELAKLHYNNFRYASDVEHVLQQIGVRQANWIGTSMGGVIGMIIAGRTPDLVKNLVLNDIGPSITFDALITAAKTLNLPVEFASFDQARGQLKARYAGFGDLSESQWTEVTRNSTTRLDNGRYRFAYDPRVASGLKRFAVNPCELSPEQLQKLLSDHAKLNALLYGFWQPINQPILAIRGAESIVLTSEIASGMETKPNCETRSIPGVGHAPMFHSAEQLNLLLTWLDDRQ